MTAQERYRKNKAAGKCTNCSAPAVPGRVCCQKCQNKMKVNSHRNNNIYRANNRNKTQVDIYNGTPKKCCICDDTLPRVKQYWNSSPSHLDGLNSECVECKALIMGKREANKKNEPYNPDNHTAQTLRELKKLGCYFAAFGGCSGELCCEHNHKTGRIRGFVCQHHNKTLLKAIDTLLEGKPRREAGEILIQLFPKIIEYIYNPPGKQLGKQTVTVSIPIASNILAL